MKSSMTATGCSARRDGPRVRQWFTRNGYDWTERFPLIAGAMATLKIRSCLG